MFFSTVFFFTRVHDAFANVSHFHDALADLFSVQIYTSVHFLCFATHALGGCCWIPCSIGGSFLSLFAALFLFFPVSRASLVSLCILSPFFVHFFDFLSHSILPFCLHAHTLCQLWYNIRTNVSTKFTPTSLPSSQINFVISKLKERMCCQLQPISSSEFPLYGETHKTHFLHGNMRDGVSAKTSTG